MKVCIRVDLKIVKVFYSREIVFKKPVSEHIVYPIDEIRYEQVTSHVSNRYEDKHKMRFFREYREAVKYAEKLLNEHEQEILNFLKSKNIPESAITIFK